MNGCDQEMCPMWDGHGCPCNTFGFDRSELPKDGTFVTETSEGVSGPESAVSEGVCCGEYDTDARPACGSSCIEHAPATTDGLS